MKCLLLSVISIVFCQLSNAQSANMPLKDWQGKAGNDFVFYISGDGGLNKFSTDLCTAINKKGYEITALNAKSYFWNRVTPDKAAADIANVITGKMHQGKFQNFVLIGYSFGADVMPFIVNRIPAALRSHLKSVILLSPSTSTDFQIHILDMLGSSSKRNMDVVAAINQMESAKTAILFGSDEKDFPINQIRLRNSKVTKLPGGHHFEGNTDELASIITQDF